MSPGLNFLICKWDNKSAYLIWLLKILSEITCQDEFTIAQCLAQKKCLINATIIIVIILLITIDKKGVPCGSWIRAIASSSLHFPVEVQWKDQVSLQDDQLNLHPSWGRETHSDSFPVHLWIYPHFLLLAQGRPSLWLWLHRPGCIQDQIYFWLVTLYLCSRPDSEVSGIFRWGVEKSVKNKMWAWSRGFTFFWLQAISLPSAKDKEQLEVNATY